MDLPDSSTGGFIENANYCESSVTYNSCQPDGVTIRMKEQGSYYGINFSHARTEFAPQSGIEGRNNGSRERNSVINGCWPTFRTQAVAATRALWDAAQSSLKAVKGRIQSWPSNSDDSITGPRWIVRITSQYDNQRGESIDDITEWEFRSLHNAELFVMHWNRQFQKKSCLFPYDITIFIKEEGEETTLEEEIKRSMAQATPRI